MTPGVEGQRLNALAVWLGRVRVRDWVHFLLLPLASASSVLGGARGVAVAALILAFGYLVNGASDRFLDGDRDKNPLIDGGTRHVMEVSVVLAVAALGLAATASLTAIVASAVCITSGVVYSIGPRWKGIPGVGTLLNLTNFLPLLWLGASGTETSSDTWLLALAFSALLLQNQLIHEAADAEEDRKADVRTTVVTIGTRLSAGLAAVLGIGVAVAFLLTQRATVVSVPLVVVGFGLVFPGLLAVQGHHDARMKRVRVVHRVSSLVAGAALFLVLRWN